ncbi:MAG: glycosyltransferase family 2 protein [Kiritimatiellae bacterium]|nr:glycosyltransferase family 2 protein [Kiritimatiellia bacterium]
MPHLSVVVPVLDEVENIGPLCRHLHEVLSATGRSYEVILVDDGSTDGTWNKMLELAGQYPHLRCVRLRTNFGQTAALSAGFHQSTGEIVITLDADLQNDPADIPLLVQRIEQGADVVCGWRKKRRDPLLTRRLPSAVANRLISKFTGVALHDYGCTLKAFRREILRDIKLYGEMHRFIPALAKWVGATLEEVEVRHHPRRHGRSKYGLGRTTRVLLDLLTVKFLMRYSQGPMRIFGKLGLLFGVPGAVLLTVMILGQLLYLLSDGTIRVAAGLVKRPFWVMSSFMLIYFGIHFIGMGFLAEILIRTWHESQDKPVYVIRQIVESKPKDGTTC